MKLGDGPFKSMTLSWPQWPMTLTHSLTPHPLAMEASYYTKCKRARSVASWVINLTAFATLVAALIYKLVHK